MALLRGVNLMAGLLAPTLGPLPRTVAITRLVGSGPPEILDSGATIARRTIEIPDPFENIGAMLVRHLVASVFERAGDGTATAAVIAQSILRSGFRYEAAGGDMAAVRRGVERGLAAVLAALARQARPIDGPTAIANLVRATVQDVGLADVIGEIVDAVGADGAVLVEAAQGTGVSYQYVDGVLWSEGVVSSSFLADGPTARLSCPRVFVTDHSLERADQLLPVLEACVGAGEACLLVIAPEVRDPVVALLLVNQRRGSLKGVLAVRAPSIGAQRTGILEDIATITGGRCVRSEAGERLEDVTLEHLGRAHQAWATRATFGVLGGAGSKDAVRRRIAQARAELAGAGDDRHVRTKLQERIGKLAGTGATIRVGGLTEAAQAELQLRVEAALTAARLALSDGAVPGGGAGLLAAAAAVEDLGLCGDELFGARMLAKALAQPMRLIAAHAGFAPGAIQAAARERGPDWAFDVVGGDWVNVWEHGLLDPCQVIVAAVEAAASAAASALTTGALVRTRPRRVPGS